MIGNGIQENEERYFSMRHIIIFVVCMTLLYSMCLAEEKLDVKDEKAKLSYSAGYQVGGDFLIQDLEINPDMLMKGVLDGLAGKGPLMTHQEMRSTLTDLQRTVAAARERKSREQAEKNLKNGRSFLSENSMKDGIKVLPSGLQYRIGREGTGKTPKAGDFVTVHYRGTLIDGTEFDSSFKQEKPATFRADRVIDGWKEALQLMKEGGRWQLFVPPDLAYGDKRTGIIGPNSTLVFEIELISVNSEKP
jgi:FKBP-type peptidyl-prolyl cis-trans isomerase